MKVREIPEHVIGSRRLGRHVEHDPRSRSFIADKAPTLKRISHRRYGPVLDQGNIGSCTGNATAQAINTKPTHIVGKMLREFDATQIYSLATKLDEFDGEYPPYDTGSSGLAAAKAATQLGYITNYKWAFGIDQALAALQLAPVITGVEWYEGFDYPDSNGLVKLEGQVRGGHEFEVAGYYPHEDPLDSLVSCWNSWGLSYGIDGKFYMKVRDWATLLENDGDVTILSREC